MILQNHKRKKTSLELYKAERKRLIDRSALSYIIALWYLEYRIPSVNDADNCSSEDIISLIRSKHLEILIVDDDANFRKSLGFKLRRKYGAEVQEAETGIVGIKKLHDGQVYDLILLDIRMPLLSGVETYHEMIKVNPESRITIMSAYSDNEEWNRAKELGVPLLSKPISEETLVEILNNC